VAEVKSNVTTLLQQQYAGGSGNARRERMHMQWLLPHNRGPQMRPHP